MLPNSRIPSRTSYRCPVNPILALSWQDKRKPIRTRNASRSEVTAPIQTRYVSSSESFAEVPCKSRLSRGYDFKARAHSK